MVSKVQIQTIIAMDVILLSDNQLGHYCSDSILKPHQVLCKFTQCKKYLKKGKKERREGEREGREERRKSRREGRKEDSNERKVPELVMSVEIK